MAELASSTAVFSGCNAIVGGVAGQEGRVHKADAIEQQFGVVVERPSNHSLHYFSQEGEAEVAVEVLTADGIGRLAVVNVIHDRFLGGWDGIWVVLKQTRIME
jgi:hypothetical protein